MWMEHRRDSKNPLGQTLPRRAVLATPLSGKYGSAGRLRQNI